MQPALKEGDRILVTGDLKELKRGDVIVYYYPFDETKSYISRVIGLPNEQVEISEGRVSVDGVRLEEPYVDPDNNRALTREPPVKIPEDSYFVMGDNRDNASDSRVWGPLSKKFIYGKLVSKY